MRLLSTTAIAAGLLLSVGAANALTIVQNVAIPNTPTTFTDNSTLSFAKFNLANGTLNSVSISFTGNVLGDIKAESLDTSPSTLTLNIAATEVLKTPLGATLAVALPTATQTFNASAYDGITDFGGTSGVTFTGLSNVDTVTGGPYVSGTTYNEFIGLGNIVLKLTATGASGGTGAGNLTQNFSTQAGADVTVTYDWTPNCSFLQNCPVPEPASMSLLGMGLVGLGALARRRRAAK